jgi:hypothetical protein
MLIHRLPPKPDYLRVKVRRRLDRIGAVPIKNSVYVLPNRPDAGEDFEWLALEIQKEGGDALVCLSEIVAGMTDDEIIARFNADRTEAYRSTQESIASELRAAKPGSGKSSPDWREEIQNSYARAQRHLAEIVRLDFFRAEGRSEAEEELRKFHELLERKSTPASSGSEIPSKAARNPQSARRPQGATWVTRAGVFVDRIASAWLIRRFIDPDARFKFVKVARYPGAPGEFRFDMVPAEFTHDGDMCTFEVLLDRFDLHEAGLIAISEVVHDIDLKDEKFARSEAPGIEAVLGGIVNAVPDDDARLAAAFPLFDALYDRFRASTG